MTGKFLRILTLTMMVQMASAQDVIVKKDGSTIISKVLEVNTDNIKYKKFSNQNGPTYTINLTDVMAINYENGEKDTFENASKEMPIASHVTNPVPTINYEALANDNLPLIRDFNTHDVEYKGTDTDKKAGGVICTLGIKDGSIIETPEMKASFSMKKKFMAHNFSATRMKHSRIGDIKETSRTSEDSHMYMIAVTLKNKTDKTIYIDLGTSYVITGDESVPYYVPTATTTSGNSSGGSVNMGSVAGALGVGGALGTLAGGINVGGESSSSTSTTTYTQRVVSVPPMASISLEPQNIGHGFTWEGGRRRYFESMVKSCYDYFDGKGFAKRKDFVTKFVLKG